MGYTTKFTGSFAITPALKPEHSAYLKAFNYTRRMKRDAKQLEGVSDPKREAAGLPLGGPYAQYYVGSEDNFGQGRTEDILDYNSPPPTQPGLWCQWIPSDSGDALEWDHGEKFYDYTEWLEYLIEHFLAPWGYKVNGEVEWRGEESGDLGKIVVTNNAVAAHAGKVIYETRRLT